MIALFTENPWPLIMVIIALEGIFLCMFYIQQKLWILSLILGSALMACTAFLCDYLVITPREEVEMAVDEGLASLESNNAQRIYALLAPNHTILTRSRIREGLQLVRITSVRANSLKITVNELVSPPTARADFYGVIRYKPRTSAALGDYYSARMSVFYEKQGNKWLVTGHEERSPLGK